MIIDTSSPNLQTQNYHGQLRPQCDADFSVTYAQLHVGANNTDLGACTAGIETYLVYDVLDPSTTAALTTTTSCTTTALTTTTA